MNVSDVASGDSGAGVDVEGEGDRRDAVAQLRDELGRDHPPEPRAPQRPEHGEARRRRAHRR